MNQPRQKWTITNSDDDFIGTVETSMTASRDTVLAIAYHRWPTILHQYHAVKGVVT